MGSAHLSPKYQPFNWQEIQPHLFRNRITGETIHHCLVELESEEQFASYKSRVSITHPRIVRLLHYSRAPPSSGECLSSRIPVSLYIEGNLIPLQTYLGHSENGLKCHCSQIIKAFASLKQSLGPFQVTKDMIWMKNGSVKVWLNSNPFSNEYKPVKEAIMTLQVQQALLEIGCPLQTDHIWTEKLESLQNILKAKKHQKNQATYFYAQYANQKKQNQKLRQLLARTINHPIQEKNRIEGLIQQKQRIMHRQVSHHNSVQAQPIHRTYSPISKPVTPTIVPQAPQRKSNSHYIPSASAHRIKFSYESTQTPYKKQRDQAPFIVNSPYTPINNSGPSATNTPWKSDDDSLSTVGKNELNIVHLHIRQNNPTKFVSNQVKGKFQDKEENIFSSNYQTQHDKSKQIPNKCPKVSFNQTMPAAFKKQFFTATKTNRKKNDQPKRKVQNAENDNITQFKAEKAQSIKQQDTVQYDSAKKKQKGQSKLVLSKITEKKKKKKQSISEVNAQSTKEQQAYLLQQYVDRMNSQTFLKLNSTNQNSFMKKIQSFEQKQQLKKKRQMAEEQKSKQQENENEENIVVADREVQKNEAREELKRAMQNLLNIDFDQEKNIQRKVAAKRAYFADLKKQAFKILS